MIHIGTPENLETIPKVVLGNIIFHRILKKTFRIYLCSRHGRSQDFFRGGEHFFKKIFKKFSKKIQKIFKKNSTKIQKILKNIQKNFLKISKKFS